MLPEGWELLTVRDLVSEIEAGVSVNGDDRPIGPGEVGVLRVSCVSSGMFLSLEHKTIVGTEVHRARTSPKANRIIVSRSNTEALVGASAYIEADHPNLFLSDKLWQLSPTSDRKVEMRWLAYWLAADQTRAVLKTFGTGTSGSMKNISKDELLDLEVLTPSFVEQQIIAARINTWERAILVAEQLRANSRINKIALVSRLLRPQPGWLNAQFDELFKVVNRKEAQVVASEYLPKGRIPIVDQGQRFIAGYTDDDSVYIDPPMIVFGDHTRAVKWVDFKFRPGADGTQLLSPKPGIHPKLAYHLLANAAIPNLGYSRHMSFVKQLNFSIPQNIEEQIAIALRLDTADKTTASLEAQGRCLAQEKQALMQDLLTGKRRVKLETCS